MSKVNLLLDFVLNTAASLKGTGIHLIRIAIFIIFVWIGGLKFWNYEAEGIVPFVANSPFMSFFYTKKAPEYKDYKLKEGEFDKVKHDWHEANNTYTFSHGLGIAIMSFGILTLLGIWFPKIGFVGSGLVILMTFGTLSFLVPTPEVWVRLRKWRARVPVTYWCGSSGYQGCMYSGRSGRCLGRLCTTNP